MRYIIILCFNDYFSFFIFLIIFFLVNSCIIVYIKQTKLHFKLDLLIKFVSFFNRNFKLIFNFIRVRFILFIEFLKDTNKRKRAFIDAVYENFKKDNYK